MTSLALAALLGAAPWLGGELRAQPRELREERMIAPGVKYLTLRREAGPRVIRVIEVERVGGYIRMLPAPASESAQALAPLSEIAARVSTEAAYAVAGVNGDYFVMEPGPAQGDPLGVAVIDGEVASTPFPRSALVIDQAGRASIQLLRLEAWVAREDGGRHPIHAVNEARGADRMILYTPRYGAGTRTNRSGTEVMLGAFSPFPRAGVTASATVGEVRRRGGDTPIPAEGLVLSGHGTAAAFLEGLAPGERLTLRLDFQPPLPEGAHVLGGGPRLLREGKEVWRESAREERFGEHLTLRRHPRTAVGIAGSRLLLVTVDGRQPEASVGMDLAELSALMRELGCTEALNLDGGGSTTLWVRGVVENRPSEGRERRIANALLVVSTAPIGPPARLVLVPREIALLAGASVPLVLSAEDEHYNPVPLPDGDTVWEAPPELGRVDEEGRFLASTPPAPVHPEGVLLTAAAASLRSGLLVVRQGGLRAEARVRVYDRPAALEIRPTPPVPGAAVSFTLRARDETGQPLAVPQGAVRWECDPAIGRIDADGHLVAAAGPARGKVAATLFGVRAEFEIAVGSVDRIIDDFEMPAGWRATTYPAEVVGSVAPTETRPYRGRRALSLLFDFTRGAGSRALYATAERELGAPLALRLRVRGDGSGAWLRARLRDAKGVTHMLDFSRSLGTLADWQELRATVPAAAVPPLKLESIYLVEIRRDARSRGEVMLDDLVGEYAPR